MSLFDSLVDESIRNQPALGSLRIVIEKELLHHDILKVMNDHKFLETLTFIGGTCLRCCYGSSRLREDLYFTGGKNFSRKILLSMKEALIDTLHTKYGLIIRVDERVVDKKNVDTWKVKVQTRPKSRNIPAQSINIDICSVPSYE